MSYPARVDGLVIWYICIFTKSTKTAGCYTMSIFKRASTGLNSKLLFLYTSCPTKVKDPTSPENLSIAGVRIPVCISLLLVLCEIQTALSSIWTRFVMFMSYHDNRFTTLSRYPWLRTVVVLFNPLLRKLSRFITFLKVLVDYWI